MKHHERRFTSPSGFSRAPPAAAYRAASVKRQTNAADRQPAPPHTRIVCRFPINWIRLARIEA
jgi:hypothetical protein